MRDQSACLSSLVNSLEKWSVPSLLMSARGSTSPFFWLYLVGWVRVLPLRWLWLELELEHSFVHTSG
eukprot:scaffold33345_cov123-Isochrysis_galbana.AAC.6